MSNLREIVSRLDRYQLERIIELAQVELSGRRPYRLTELAKTCGAQDCRCQQGYLHGPYLYAIFQNGTGKQTQKSLGRVLIPEDFEAMSQEPFPQIFNFRISDRRLKSNPNLDTRQAKGWKKHELSDSQYLAHYGVGQFEDTFERPTQIWIDQKRYGAAHSQWNNAQKIASNRWKQWGLGTKDGIRYLEDLESQGYYHEW